MSYYNQPENLQKVQFVSVWVVIFSVLQFAAIFFYKYVVGIDNTQGYVAGYVYPIIYVVSIALVLTVINNIVRKTIGLFDMVLVAIVFIVSYLILN